MKKIIFTLLLFSSYEIGLSQQKYDDGPITGGGNFVVSGTWGRNSITFSFLNGQPTLQTMMKEMQLGKHSNYGQTMRI